MMVQRDYDDKFVLFGYEQYYPLSFSPLQRGRQKWGWPRIAIVLSSVILNLIQDLKRFRVRPGMTVAAISVLFTIILAGLACDSGGSTDGDDSCDAPKDDRPAWCDDNADATVNPGSDTDEQGYCGDGVCSANENCDCFECLCADGEVCTDGVCGEDPLKDYYWIEGTWKRESVNGNPSGLIVDVTIEAWDPELGAEVHGFTPLNMSYIKKNTETNEFILFIKSEGGCAQGLANPNTLTVEFNFCDADCSSLCGYTIYVKL